MFGLLNYHSGYLVMVSMVLLALIAVSSYDTNQKIHQVNNANRDNPYSRDLPLAPFWFIIVVIVVLFFALASPLKASDDDYEALQTEKDDLELKYEELKESVDASYDSAVVLKFYFNGSEEVSEQLAKDSVKDLYDHLYPGEY